MMKTILSGILLSLCALILWGVTLTRGIREPAPESRHGITHAKRSAVSQGASGPADPHHPSPRTHARPSSAPRLSHIPHADPFPPANPIISSRPSAIARTEDPEFSGSPRIPREERGDVSFATSHKQRLQAARSPFPLRNGSFPAESPLQTAHPDTPLSAVSALSADTSSFPFQPADEDFRFRQIYGQQAWMARHIQMYNGTPADPPDQRGR